MENTAVTMQPRNHEPGKHPNFPTELNSSVVISYCAIGDVLGMGILKEFLEFHIHKEVLF